MMPFILRLEWDLQKDWIFRRGTGRGSLMQSALFMLSGIRDTDQVAVGEKVAVIGMGMTAIDAATQAKRLGAKRSNPGIQTNRKGKALHTVELDIALLDGCKIIWLAAPKNIIGEEGKVKALECSVMQLVSRCKRSSLAC
jgi:glutamate synthase (NADPH/NADH) small chain